MGELGNRRLLAPIFGVAVLLAIVLDVRFRPEPRGVDFHTYEAAAVVGLQHGWSDIYDQGLVTIAQHHLVPTLWTQPYLSPPPVAWLAAPFASLPYGLALDVWSAATLVALVGALAWSTYYRGVARVIAVGAAVAPWWVFSAVHVGQVAPLVAASVLVAWRLLREDRNVAAGLVLTLVLLKPNTAIFAPVALVAIGRMKAFGAWAAGAAVVAGVSLLAIGPHGTATYISDLGHQTSAVMRGAGQLTLSGTLGATGAWAAVLRTVIVVVALAATYRFRGSPGLALAAGAMASLMTAPYLHGSDLCVFLAAGWIVWNERTDPLWRALLAGIWLISTPYLVNAGLGPPLNRWLLCELALMIGLVVDAWARERAFATPAQPLTGGADFGSRAPA